MEELSRSKTLTIELTERELQILSDAIKFIWKSGAVLSREAADELGTLEDRIENPPKPAKPKKT